MPLHSEVSLISSEVKILQDQMSVQADSAGVELNVAVIMPLSRQRGGGELMFKQLLANSHETSIHWHAIFFSDGPLVEDVKREGVTTHIVDAGRLRQPIKFARCVRDIRRIIRSNNCQLVFSWSAKPHLYGGVAALFTNVESTWYQLGSPHGTHLSILDRIATFLPAKFIFVLSRMGQQAQRRLWPKRKTVLVYPGVDIDEFGRSSLPSKEQARSLLNIDHDGPIVGIVGRLQRWKGMHVLIEALPQVLEHHPETLCLIVGGKHEHEPEYELELRSAIAQRRLEKNVRMVGHQTNIPMWMQAMDVVVHASDHEPFGIVVVEAMALGKPVIASSSGGPAEIIQDGLNGVLVPFGDSNALGTALVKCLEDQSFSEQISRNAEERANDFTLPKYVASVLNTITSVTYEDSSVAVRHDQSGKTSS